MENNPLYQQGLKHFVAREWAEAVTCFSQLQTAYPGDPSVTQFLETARLRSEMKTGLERDAKSQVRRSWLRRATILGVFVLVLALIGGVWQAYRLWAAPAQQETARLAHAAKMRQTAQVQIASGSYASAIETYQGLLAEWPDDPEAAAGLVHAQQLEQAATLYAQATAALNAGDQAEAMRLLGEINQMEQNYRDTASLMEQIKSAQALNQAYDDAVKLYEANDWAGAVQSFETIRSSNSGFKAQEIKDYLFKIYLQLGDQQVEQAKTVTDLQVAEGYYQQALSVHPLDAKADASRRLVTSFVDGAGAYQTKDWETTIRKLAPVYEQQPGYFGGQVAAWLYEAYMATGDAMMRQNDPFGARDRFARALSLAPTEGLKADAQKKFEVADRLTTPTPTVAPSPTPRSTPTPLPAGYVAPAWARPSGGAGATPDPYQFVVINRTYFPSGSFGQAACNWSGVAGRLFDMLGAPMTKDTLGLRVEGPDTKSVVAGSYPVVGPSGWMVQWDAAAKVIKGQVQVYYKDKPVSAPIFYSTRDSCFENFIIIDIQQIKPLP
jgi:outer membrane protein assembly factor BamD (BamD/ComL family)